MTKLETGATNMIYRTKNKFSKFNKIWKFLEERGRGKTVDELYGMLDSSQFKLNFQEIKEIIQMWNSFQRVQSL